jgi:hypothetical protein
VPELLRPASSYTQNYLVEKMPWRAAFDWLFSGWRYIALVGLAVILIVRHRGRLSSARLVRRYGWFFVFYGLIALPILFSNRFRPEDESVGPIWTDASRQKVFLEAPVMVMLAYAAWVTFSSLRKTRSQKAKAEIAESLADRL